MLKKPMQPVACALFALIVGWPQAPAEAHCAGRHTGDHPHCTGDGGGGGGEYDVTVSGDLSFADTLTGVDGGGSSKPVNVYFQFPELDLGFFFDKFGGVDGLDGQRCFSGAHWGDSGSAITISQLRDDSARVRIWFRGFGRDGETEVKYQLVMSGGFPDPEDWPPAVETTAVLTDWYMETESKKAKNPCRSELFTEPIVEQVRVTRTN